MRVSRYMSKRLLPIVLTALAAGCVHRPLAAPSGGTVPPAPSTRPETVAQLPALPPLPPATELTPVPSVPLAAPTPLPALPAASPPPPAPIMTLTSSPKTPPPVAPDQPPTPPAQTNPGGSDNQLAKLRSLYQAAEGRFATIDSFVARLRRREQVGGKDGPEEVLLFRFRKAPYSVHLKWLGDERKGREVLYTHGRTGDQLHTLLAAGDMPFTPAGKRISLPRDSILVRSASRHDITEAGLGLMIESVGKAVAALERNPTAPAHVRYLGREQRPEYAQPLECVECDILPNVESAMPRGGRRRVFFDPESSLPVVIITSDHTGREVEYYCYDRLQYPVKLADEDFNPEILWKRP